MLHIAYFSPTQTTEKVCLSVAKGLNIDYTVHDFTLPKNRGGRLTLSGDDILVIGVPVYAGRVPNLILDQLKRIDGNSTKAVLVAVYGNRDYDDALLELSDIISGQEFNVIAGAAFIGEHSYTDLLGHQRPDANDLSKALEFGKKIKLKIDKKLFESIGIKGNRPYKTGMGAGFGPVVSDRCLKCGICAINCPSGALVYTNAIRVIDDQCIRCHKCVKVCPVYAINFDERIQPAKEWLVNNFTKRKEPEIFI